jgi:chemotaxis-related protein WspB
MLLLLFCVGQDLYSINSAQVSEVIPRVPLRALHHVPKHVAGLLNYRGTIVPIVDLCQLIQNTPSQMQLSTRIIIVQSNDPTMPHIGVLAEKVIKTLNKSKADLVDSPNAHRHMSTAPYLGGMIMDEKGMIQQIHLDHLFAEFRQIYRVATDGVTV